MAIKITIEIDTPEEAARLIAQLPGLAHSLPLVGGLDQLAHQKTDRALRYELYKSNGGRVGFLGWSHMSEPAIPADEVNLMPADQVEGGPLELRSQEARLSYNRARKELSKGQFIDKT